MMIMSTSEMKSLPVGGTPYYRVEQPCYLFVYTLAFHHFCLHLAQLDFVFEYRQHQQCVKFIMYVATNARV